MHGVSQSVSQSVIKSVSHSVSQSVSQSLSQPASHSVSQPVTRSVSQSVSHSVTLTLSQALSQSLTQSVCQLVSRQSFTLFIGQEDPQGGQRYSSTLSRTSALDGVGVSPTPWPHLPAGKTRYPFYRRLGGPQGRSGRAGNLVPNGIRSQTVQPVVSIVSQLVSYIMLYLCSLRELPVKQMETIRTVNTLNIAAIYDLMRNVFFKQA